MTKRLAAIWTTFLLLVACANVAAAKSPREYATGVKDYALSPLHWDSRDWQWVGGAAAGIATAYSLDLRVRDHFVDGTVAPGQDPMQWRDAAPLAALTVGTYFVGRLRHDNGLTHTGTDMVEAVALSALSSLAIKTVVARTRPNETADRADWRNGGDSMPSLHVSAAFAAARVFADRMPREQWGWRMLAYGLAGATAYARLDSNVHWLSDTVAGATLGLATGRFVSGRGAESHSPVSMMIVPVDHGALLTFSLDSR
ncbi:MAG: phosphatase PAP2 family protein [Steroidobacteraceae bacterium]